MKPSPSHTTGGVDGAATSSRAAAPAEGTGASGRVVVPSRLVRPPGVPYRAVLSTGAVEVVEPGRIAAPMVGLVTDGAVDGTDGAVEAAADGAADGAMDAAAADGAADDAD